MGASVDRPVGLVRINECYSVAINFFSVVRSLARSLIPSFVRSWESSEGTNRASRFDSHGFIPRWDDLKDGRGRQSRSKNVRVSRIDRVGRLMRGGAEVIRVLVCREWVLANVCQACSAFSACFACMLRMLGESLKQVNTC